jgi:DNA-binding transcriptional MerR regulator
MEKHRAIPKGHMTVGEVAKKMGTTVRTLQYYDKEGLLSPSAESEGGFRLYTDRDMVKLHQILSMKYVGFSLGDIKNRLTSIETPADMADVLTKHAESISNKMKTLSESLKAIDALKAEVIQMQTVDFGKYAAIIASLQMKNKHYQFVKYMSEELIEHSYGFNDSDKEKSSAFIDKFNRIINIAVQFQKDGISPESEECLALAKSWWDMTMEFTGGDMSLLPKLKDYFDNIESGSKNSVSEENLVTASNYISPALGIYLESLGYKHEEYFRGEKHD